MTPERYKRLSDWLEGHPALREGIILLNRWLPLVPFVCYPVLLVLLNLRWFTMLTIGRGGGALDFMQVIARAILVPGLAFGLGTILRARLNFPRPYEQPGFVPLVSKETHGNSCPSRHALSAAVLGMVWLYFYPAVGVVVLAIAALICLLRVLSGAHFVRDVLAGAAKDIALLIGPEGGLSEAEIQQANQAGFKNWCIGSRVLRTETAPVVALSILNYSLAR